jgi:hypothetical protein
LPKKPKNEQRVCQAVMSLVAQRRGEYIMTWQPVDAFVRDRPAVERDVPVLVEIGGADIPDAFTSIQFPDL